MLMERITAHQDSIITAVTSLHKGILCIITGVLAYIIYRICVYLFEVATNVRRRKTVARDAILLMGQCNAGKTRLFYALQGEKYIDIPTITSMKPNMIILKNVEAPSPIASLQLQPGIATLVDYPGHPRLSGKLHEWLIRARSIIYLLDSTDKPSIKASAEQLYDLFVQEMLIETQTPILLFCNKKDLATAKTSTAIRDDIQREIERLRVSRAATLENEDAADRFTGVEGKKFELEDASVPVTLSEGSVANNEIEDILTFMSS